MLNVRVVSTFMLAFAAVVPVCRPYIKKYFNQIIVLPSEWISVAELYQVGIFLKHLKKCVLTVKSYISSSINRKLKLLQLNTYSYLTLMKEVIRKPVIQLRKIVKH